MKRCDEFSSDQQNSCKIIFNNKLNSSSILLEPLLRRGEDDELPHARIKAPRGTNGGVIMSSLSYSMSYKRTAASNSPVAKYCDILAKNYKAVCTFLSSLVLFLFMNFLIIISFFVSQSS